jgi:hypothetical protein
MRLLNPHRKKTWLAVTKFVGKQSRVDGACHKDIQFHLNFEERPFEGPRTQPFFYEAKQAFYLGRAGR